MIASELISEIVPPIKSTDTVGKALDWMNEFKLAQLPIVDDGVYKGLITEDEILETADPMLLVGQVKRSGWEGVVIFDGKHVYDAIRIMSDHKVEILPVLDEAERYIGLITLRDLREFLGIIFAVNEPGGVIVVEIPKRGYVLSEIGRIVESTDAKVLSLYLSAAGEGKYLATIKVNVEDLSKLLASFNRFDYTVIQTFSLSDRMKNYRKNLDALLNYLDI